MALILLGSGPGSMPSTGVSRADDSQEKPKHGKPQQPNTRRRAPQIKDDTPIRLGTDLVVLDVTVLDPANKPVTDLTKESFQVTEDKVPQEIKFFGREQVPVSMVFAIDTSGSMRTKLDTVIKASSNLIKESKSGDEMAVIEFKLQPDLMEEFTKQRRRCKSTRTAGLIASGQTRCWTRSI